MAGIAPSSASSESNVLSFGNQRALSTIIEMHLGNVRYRQT
jgi:hypothetical protein